MPPCNGFVHVKSATRIGWKEVIPLELLLTVLFVLPKDLTCFYCLHKENKFEQPKQLIVCHKDIHNYCCLSSGSLCPASLPFCPLVLALGAPAFSLGCSTFFSYFHVFGRILLLHSAASFTVVWQQSAMLSLGRGRRQWKTQVYRIADVVWKPLARSLDFLVWNLFVAVWASFP